MIVTKNNTTSIQFAEKVEEGVISLGVCGNQLILQELIEPKHVVESRGKLKKEDARDLPKVVLNFHCVESIDNLIADLNKIKFNINYPYGAFALAC